MVERIPDMPAGTLGFIARGEVTRADYVDVLEPALKQVLAEERRLRILFQLGPDLEAFEPGALWEEIKSDVDLGIRHHRSWERLALVTDVGWARRAASLFGWMAPGEFRLFSLADFSEAKTWVGAERA